MTFPLSALRHSLHGIGSTVYTPGEIITEHGQSADSAYIVLAGSCEVTDDREGNDSKSGKQAPFLFLHTVATDMSVSVKVQTFAVALCNFNRHLLCAYVCRASPCMSPPDWLPDGLTQRCA